MWQEAFLGEVDMQIKESNMPQKQAKNQRKQQNHISEPQHRKHRSWWCASIVGYVLGLFCTIMALLLTLMVANIGHAEHIHDFFVGVPFATVTVLSGWLWGLGPALVVLAIGVLSLDYWVIPPICVLTFYKWPDIVAFLPFIGIQLIALYLIMVQKRYRQQLLVAQQKASKQAEALAQSNAQLEQADRVKDQFLSMASHELRTPVTSIHGYVQLLMRRLKKQSTETPELLPIYDSLLTVDQQTKRLAHLVDDLLDINSLRAGKMPLHISACDLGNLCRNVAAEHKDASERTIDLQLAPHKIILPADEKRLSQVISNLVTNAIKYSPKQSVVRMEVSQSATEAILSVHNEGPTLSQEQQIAIFEPFYRSPEAQSSTISGWGLGLAISKEIVARHQGRIWVESSQETGTTFFVALALEVLSITEIEEEALQTE